MWLELNSMKRWIKISLIIRYTGKNCLLLILSNYYWIFKCINNRQFFPVYLIISDILIHLFMELSSSHILSYKTCYFFPVRIARTFIWVYFLVAQWVKNQPPVQETRVQSLGWEDPLEMEMATHSSILAWRIPWTEETDGLQSMGLQRVRQDWAPNT